MFKKLFLAPVMACGLLLGGPAAAGPLLTPEASYAFSVDFGAPAGTISISGFDASLGTLTSVHLTLQFDAFIVQSFASNTGRERGVAFNVSGRGTVAVSGPAGLEAGATSSTSSVSTSIGIGGLTILSTNSAVPADASDVVNGDPTSLAAYLASSVALTLDNTTLLSGSCFFPATCGVMGTASGTVLVQYDYEARTAQVAEPASLALLGVSGVAAGFSVRRRRAS